MENPLESPLSGSLIPAKTQEELLAGHLLNVYELRDYPTLSHQIESWPLSRPLAGKRILDATPLFTNTLLKHRALVAAGAELSLGISEVMAYDPQVVSFLRQSGFEVVTPSEALEKEAHLPWDIVLDCAGAFKELSAREGVVELTRSGVRVYEEKGEGRVFLADSGKIKWLETYLGTGEAYFRAMESLGYREWEGKSLLVFGRGKVGQGILAYGLKKGAKLFCVTDLQEEEGRGESALGASYEVLDWREKTRVLELFVSADAVVTATGKAHALEESLGADFWKGSQALLANMGVEDEYGPSVPESRVLAGKKPLNFLLKEPTLLKYIETTMALHNVAAVYLGAHPEEKGLILPPEELEEELLALVKEKGSLGSDWELLPFA